MSTRIFELRYHLPPLLPLALLAGCGGSGDATAIDGNSRSIACGTAGRPLDQTCTLTVEDRGGDLHLTLRRPDGGFRRLRWPKGGELAAADGAERVAVKPLAMGSVEAHVGNWAYRIEAKGGGLP